MIVYLHFHKCAGTSFISLFLRNGYRAYSRASGGLPFFLNNADYSVDQLKTFYLNCEQHDGVNFIAYEWWKPVFFRDGSVNHVTVLRDPFERYLSNYYYALVKCRNFTREQVGLADVEQFDSDIIYKCNYYCRLLLNKHGEEEITEADYVRAVAELSKIETVCILEKPETFASLERLGVDLSGLQHLNKSTDDKEYSEDFKRSWVERNEFDYRLYDTATRLLGSG